MPMRQVAVHWLNDACWSNPDGFYVDLPKDSELLEFRQRYMVIRFIANNPEFPVKFKFFKASDIVPEYWGYVGMVIRDHDDIYLLHAEIGRIHGLQ